MPFYIYQEDHHFHEGSFEVVDGLFGEINVSEEIVEYGKEREGYYVIPGLVDIHFHGCMGVDFCDALPDGLAQIAQYEASVGVTSICPASMTMSREELMKIMATGGDYLDHVEPKGAHFLGINMEGPFIHKDKKGAQAEENIIPCDVDLFRQLQEEARGQIRLVDIAPEVAGAMEFIDSLKGEVNISIAHTTADYDCCTQAFQRGANHVTHMMNAMPAFHHRDPGPVGAALDHNAWVELITDGIHIHPSMIRAIFRMFPEDKICLISDSMRATGLEDGQYTLGGQKVDVKGNRAELEDGTIAGSVTNLMECIRVCVDKVGIPLEKVICCATENPAASIGFFHKYGSIKSGKHADYVILDHNLHVVSVYIDGKKVKGELQNGI